MVREMHLQKCIETNTFSPYTYKYISVVQIASEEASGRQVLAVCGGTQLKVRSTHRAFVVEVCCVMFPKLYV